MRITHASLAALVDQFSERDRAILADLERARVLTGAQLQRLHFTPVNQDSRARDRRRVLQRLTDLDLVSTLDRRIGGIRAGSAGHVYTLTPVGRRLQALQRGQQLTGRLRHPRTPGAPFLNHALAISEIYVTLIETSRHHDFHVSTFQGEPACWHPTGHNNQYLHPDAYLVLATSAHQDCWWLEVDQATESLPRIKRKCRSYLDFLIRGGVGPDAVPPRILFTTPDADRCDAIRKVITKVSTTEADQLINVTTHTHASKFLITELAEP
ncbi:MAG: replication-relaxation family protein [Actinomycetota bacterium]|nr:replication-relaxation family protein [Actinomycetota bacterium]